MDQHYFLLYYTQHIITDVALIQTMNNIPTMDDLDSEPNIEELYKGVTEMTPWKASDSDGIPA